MSRRAVFLDRDGTLNHDPGYLDNPDKFSFYPGVTDALRLLQQHRYRIFVVSNQSGLARGLLTEKDLERIHHKMTTLLQAEGITLDGVYYCPHHPDERCTCRKPSPRLVEEAAAAHEIALTRSFFIGDRTSDIETGIHAGCRTVLVLTGEGETTRRNLGDGVVPDYIARDLSDAAEWICGKGKVNDT